MNCFTRQQYKIIISHSGVHQISVVDYAPFRERLLGATDRASLANYVDAYLLSLRPLPSPLLNDRGELSEEAKRGEAIFHQLGCDNCHRGEYYTDGKMYRIGDDVEFEMGWDTPTLREVWRTAPYLFDGRAATLEEVVGKYHHGVYRELSQEEITRLAEFVGSL